MKKENNQVLKALVVDDNEVNTLILANMLELFDIAADVASSGSQAIDMLKEKKYDIIFIDHVMPEMDGVQTTEAIRSIFSQERRMIIIALTSSKTEEIQSLYQSVGADDVYAKPIDLYELEKLLRQTCPGLSIPNCEFRKQVLWEDGIEQRIEKILEEIVEINISTGLQYVMRDHRQYIELLRISLKDIQVCFQMIKNGYEKHVLEDMRIGVHNIKSVFFNIGALNLAELTKELEQYILKRNLTTVEFYYIYYMDRIENLYTKLILALNRYDDLLKNLKEDQEDIALLMSGKEYEQSIDNAIYYIKRYDYIAILSELKLLRQSGKPEHRSEFELALGEIMDYQYENILTRLISIKKEIEQSPI